MGVGSGAAYVYRGSYIFGGQSIGYKTLYQNKTYDVEQPFYDTYLFNYNPRDAPDCIYNSYMTGNDVRAKVNKYVGNDYYTTSRQSSMFRKMNNYLVAYYAQYNGRFPLQ